MLRHQLQTSRGHISSCFNRVAALPKYRLTNKIAADHGTELPALSIITLGDKWGLPHHPGSASRTGRTRTFASGDPQRLAKREHSPERAPQHGASSGSKESSQQGPSEYSNWNYLVALAALSVVICYADRSNLSTAILPMGQAFGWDKGFQGIVLSSFFAGYALTQVVGGQLADRYGGKAVLAAGVAIWSFFTYATPWAAAQGTLTLLTARVLLGVGEGVAFPSIHSLISRNVPYENQSTAVGIVTAASYAGTALAFGISPYLISNFGWQWVFYIFAAFALLWLPLWLPVRASNVYRPKNSGMGSGASEQTDAELALLQQQQPSDAAAESSGGGDALGAKGFWALLKRKEVWAICVAQYTGSWGMYGLLSWLPTFFSDFYGIPISDLGGYTFVPYIVQGGTGMLAGILADKLLASGWKVRDVRIMLQVTGMLGPAACLLLAVSPIVGASAPVASSLITIGLGFSALTLGGVSVSHLDVAPRHAGVIFGAGNTAATIAGFLSVPATGFILQATNSWPLVFGVTAMHYFVGALLFSLWVGDKQLPEDLVDAEPNTATS